MTMKKEHFEKCSCRLLCCQARAAVTIAME